MISSNTPTVHVIQEYDGNYRVRVSVPTQSIPYTKFEDHVVKPEELEPFLNTHGLKLDNANEYLAFFRET